MGTLRTNSYNNTNQPVVRAGNKTDPQKRNSFDLGKSLNSQETQAIKDTILKRSRSTDRLLTSVPLKNRTKTADQNKADKLALREKDK